MKNDNSKFETVLIITLFSFCFFNLANAYNDQTTHPALTEQAVDLYNFSFADKQLTSEQKEWIIEGSILEDTPPRWINHFYDPIYKTGWTGLQAGKISQEDAKFFSSVFLSPEEPLSAVEWANNQLIQQEYSLYEGNRTYKKALEYYADGNLEEAYKTLGFIMHLVEDMAVPEHTRDDTHAQELEGITGDLGSPYEIYTAKYGRGSLNVVEELRSSGLTLPAKSSIEEYLISLAEYSNKYFFSKDTINDPKYQLPKIIREDENFGYGIDENNQEFSLAKAIVVKGNGLDVSTNYIIDIGSKTILDAYFSHLSRQAVLYGAGVINLFQKQAADAVVNKEFPTHLVKYDLSKLTLPIISLVGEGKKVAAAVQSFFASLAYITENAIYLIIGSTKDFFSSEEIISPAGNFSTGTQPIQIVEITEQESQPEILGETTSITEELSVVQPQTETKPVASNSEPPPQANLFDKLNSALAALVEQLKLILGAAGSPESIVQNFAGSVSFTTGGGASPSLGGSSGGGVQPESSSVASSTGSASSPQAGSSASSTENTAPTSTQAASTNSPQAIVNHLVISEVQISGADAGDEFIELYNPTESEIDLSSWSIQSLSGGATSTAGVKKKHFAEGNRITPKGYFLIARRPDNEGRDGYRGAKPADLWQRTLLLSGSATGTTIFLMNDQEAINGADDPNIVDRLAYGFGSGLLAESAPAPIPLVGQSIERKAPQDSSCVSAQGNNEFLGNGCDTDSNAADFEIRTVPVPQNSESLPEPRQAPAINNLRLEYSPAPRINFSWDESADALGATSTNVYAISAINSSSSSIIFSATSALAYSFSIDEVGRQYDFQFAVRDRDGLEQSTTTSVFASSFLDNFYFYRDPRGAEIKYLADLQASSTRPFWDLTDASDNQNWKLIAMYLNQDAQKQATLTTANDLGLDDPDFLRLVYRGCYGGPDASHSSLLIPWNRHSCQQGGPLSFAFHADNLEDQRFAVEASRNTGSGDFSPGDYITLAFYDFGGGGGGEQRFGLAAVDKTKYYFQTSTPPQASPSTPANLSLNFDEFHSALNLTWSGSADEDTLDYLITYEINYSTSSVFNDSEWQSVGNRKAATVEVVFGNSYMVGVRAVDDFRNVSAPATANWNFPVGYVPLPSQKDHSNVVGVLGITDGSQKIIINTAVTIDAAAMWIGPEFGWYNASVSNVNIHRDNAGSPGELIAASNDAGIGQYENNHEVLYVFNDPIILEPGAYWLTMVAGPAGRDNPNRTDILGSSGDAYPDGFWSLNPGADAYFLLRRAE